ncbi:hypothetical protein [Butyrivibrio sp. AE3006]|uniref:hypothetical protein n=1 Tax=Butyrivibrio sp. AE3006 TaxID=1280673 RepID=UPI0012DF2C76|nr:hypothetical protein [Butyrivibrio sp. AE3006]
MQIGSSNDSKAVKEQYSSSKGINTRLSFHDKCSTNKQGYGNWIVSNYEITEGMKVLELGCGTGSIWMVRLTYLKIMVCLFLNDKAGAYLTNNGIQNNDRRRPAVCSREIHRILQHCRGMLLDT